MNLKSHWFLLLFFCAIVSTGRAQTYAPNKIILRALTTEAIPTEKIRQGNKSKTDFQFANKRLQSLWDDYQIKAFRQVYPAAEKINHPNAALLRNVFEVTCDCDENVLRRRLITDAKDQYDWVDFVEIPQVTASKMKTETPPACLTNDPLNDQWQNWHLEKIGATDAWCYTTGDPAVRIAIAEPGGFDIDHEDLVDNIDLVDAVTVNPDHGTWVAGMASAATNNGKGIASVGYNTKLMLYSDTWNGILQSAVDGASVVNCSWLNCSDQPANRMAVEMAQDLGTIVVAASGNGNFGPSCTGTGVGVSPNVHGATYPASYDGVISVTAVSGSDRFERGFCCLAPCGQTEVATYNMDTDIAAPGFCTFSTYPGDNYGLIWAGTSFAAPQVAATCALMLSVNPDLCASEIEQILKSTAVDISGVAGTSTLNPNSVYTNFHYVGRLNVEAAVWTAQNYQGGTAQHIISNGETLVWSNQEIESNGIEVRSGGTLIIENESIVQLSKNAGIRVRRGGRLEINNSQLTGRCGFWAGIQVDGANKEQPQPYGPQSITDAGVLLIENNAIIELAEVAVSADQIESFNFAGGLIYAENSKFTNNKTLGHFDRYEIAPNKSAFKNCLFEEVEDITSAKSTMGFTIERTNNIRFEQCTFRNIDQNGITVFDAGVIVLNNNFEGIENAIELLATFPNPIANASQISYNTFEGNELHITTNANAHYTNLRVNNNDFMGGTIGVYLLGASEFHIDANNFDQVEVGILGIGTGTAYNMVECNTFEGTDFGIEFFNNNRNVVFYNNDFTTNNADFVLGSFLSPNPGTIGFIQGGINKPAENCFSNHNQHFLTNNLETFHYFARYADGNDCRIPEGSLNNGGSSNYYLHFTPFLGQPACDGFSFPSGFSKKAPVYEHSEWDRIKAEVVQLENEWARHPEDQGLGLELQEARKIAAEVFATLVKTSIAEADFSTSESLLKTEKSREARKTLFGLKLALGDYAAAAEFLSSWPMVDEEDRTFYEVQQLHLQKMEDATFKLSEEESTKLLELAEGTSANRAYAQALLTKMTGKRFPPQLPQLTKPKVLTVPSTSSTVPEIQLFPNPAKDQVTINFESVAQAKSLSVYDLNGKLMRQIEISKAQRQHQLAITEFPNGLYVVSVFDQNGTAYRKKLVIAR